MKSGARPLVRISMSAGRRALLAFVAGVVVLLLPGCTLVPAGVPAEVPVGVPAGVRAGVPAGVRAGVPVGVAAGVPAGVAAGVPSDAPVGTSANAYDAGREIMLMVKASRPAIDGIWNDAGAGYGSARQRARALGAARAIARAHRLELVDDWPMPALAVHCVVLRLAPDQDEAGILAALGANARVAWAQPMHAYRTLVNASAQAPSADQRGWDDVHGLHRSWTGRGITIAGVDTGIDLNHPDLAGQWTDARNFAVGREFAPELHGTAMAGVMVAKPDARIGIEGVAPGATLVPLRACWQVGAQPATCSSFTLAKAIQYALLRPVRVINLSLSGPRDTLLERLIDRAVEQGMVVVAAVDEAQAEPGFPASHPKVIAVASRRSRADKVDAVVAPGEDVLTTTPRGSWGFLSGASLSAAHVAGLSALMLEAAPRLSPMQVRAALERGSRTSARATGMIDPCAVMQLVSSAQNPPCGSMTRTSAAYRDPVQ